jgi:hypothetical protein
VVWYNQRNVVVHQERVEVDKVGALVAHQERVEVDKVGALVAHQEHVV